jgi:hypothetical protein
MNTGGIKNISYLNKDFPALRAYLINLVKTYYSNTISDFSPADPALMFIDISSVVGDILNFYLDTNVKENLLLLAEEDKNIIQMSQALGYKPRASFPAISLLDIYQTIPAIGVGPSVRPDYNYSLKIAAGAQFGSNTGVTFRDVDGIDFSYSSSFDNTSAVIYQVDTNGAPTYYLLKKTIQVESGTQKTVSFSFTNPVQYSKILLSDTNIISIDKVVDSDGNQWYEVPYLAQDTIFVDVPNIPENTQTLTQYADQTPYLLEIQRVPKRFISRYRSDGKTELQFGAGVTNEYDEVIIPNPDNVGMMTSTGMSKLNYSWAVSNFLYSDSYGEAPYNTNLTVTYTVGGGIQSNVLAGSITNITQLSYTMDETNLDQITLDAVKNSLACNNPTAATGGRDAESGDEIRFNALAYFAAQDRATTKTDYILRALSMPAKFGSIAKAYIIQDDQLAATTGLPTSNPLALNLYILSYNANKQLVNTNDAIKSNLATYLDSYRMLTDSINIKDAYVINISVNFTISVLSYFSASEVLLNCTQKLISFFNTDSWQIRQPIIISDVFRTLASVEGVQNVVDISFVNQFDTNAGYFPNVYNIDTATSNGIVYCSSDPSIFEVRFPKNDITGRVISY